MADSRDALVKKFMAKRKATSTPDQADRKRGAIGRGPDYRGLSDRYRRDQARQNRRPSSSQR